MNGFRAKHPALVSEGQQHLVQAEEGTVVSDVKIWMQAEGSRAQASFTVPNTGRVTRRDFALHSGS